MAQADTTSDCVFCRVLSGELSGSLSEWPVDADGKIRFERPTRPDLEGILAAASPHAV